VKILIFHLKTQDWNYLQSAKLLLSLMKELQVTVNDRNDGFDELIIIIARKFKKYCLTIKNIPENRENSRAREYFHHIAH
jgi:hypothetical protein